MVVVWNKVKKNIKEFVGVVLSDKMDKTVVVWVEKVKMHPIYKKRYIVRKKYYAHDENNEAKIWDKVRIRESRPLSKLKRWVVVEVIKDNNS